MKKALIKSHLAAGKDSKGKNLIKKRFPKLGLIKAPSNSAAVVQTFTLTPTSWSATNAPATSYTDNVTITSNLSTINLKVVATNVGVGFNGQYRAIKNNTTNAIFQSEGTLATGFNNFHYITIASGDQIKFDLNCPSGGGSTSIQFQVYRVVGGVDGAQLGITFSLSTNC